ncbi:MAG: hypothetical protein HYX78_14075 [Armatimonadetes bacterium]|nr:hypothetical protein [Armatimonadota bacterium]
MNRLGNGPIAIAGAGICCLDYLVTAPQVKYGCTARVRDYRVQGGGLVATALVACARLGAECDLISLLGDDEIADRICAELESENVQTNGVVRIEGGKSPFSFILVDDASGERTIFHRSGCNLRFHVDSFDSAAVGKANVLLVDNIYPELALTAAKVARDSGIPVVADLIPGETNRELLRHVDILIAPRHFLERAACSSTDAGLDLIHELGPTTAVITLGGSGWVYSDACQRGRGEAFAVDVVDTTGAGDSFHGAFAYALAAGFDTAESAEFAGAVAAIKCTKPGGRAGLPTLPQVLSFLQERSNRDWSSIIGRSNSV